MGVRTESGTQEVYLNNNKFSSNTTLNSMAAIIKVDGCYVDGDSYVSTGSSNYLINISADANTGTQVGTDIEVKNCLFKAPERALIFSNYQKVVVEGNVFQRNSALLSSMIQINSTCLFGRVTNNDFCSFRCRGDFKLSEHSDYFWKFS